MSNYGDNYNRPDDEDSQRGLGNMAGGAQQGGNMPGSDYSQEEMGKQDFNDRLKDFGKIALGVAA
ncbi:hypothetical protein IWQ57_005202, partial [Coemansia nantahalensis]